MFRNVLTVIPARGGSKGIPRKNVRMLGGAPLISYVIKAAVESKRITRTVVSTDDGEIASVSKQYGAEIIWRPETISGDTAKSEEALLHALAHLREHENYVPDLLVFLQCTSPLTRSEDIDGTVDLLLTENADSALAVVPFHYFLWVDKNGEAVGINHDKKVRLMRQEREKQFLETGAIYVMRTEGFINARHRFFGKTVMYEMHAERCLEIDEPIDLLLAESRIEAARQKRSQQIHPS